MNRLCLSAVAILALLLAVCVHGADAAVPDANTMKAVLHTAAPEEDGFIDRVLAKVDKGVLPLDMVESTFLWARKKSRHKFQYFKAGMIARAQDAGIKL